MISLFFWEIFLLLSDFLLFLIIFKGYLVYFALFCLVILVVVRLLTLTKCHIGFRNFWFIFISVLPLSRWSAKVKFVKKLRPVIHLADLWLWTDIAVWTFFGSSSHNFGTIEQTVLIEFGDAFEIVFGKLDPFSDS